MKRLGAGKGTGKGYRNLRQFPRDSSIHKQSARGLKQPQRINIFMARSGKNAQAKMRKVDDPYETWKSPDGQWEYRVLKKYQEDDNKPYARWMVAARTPATFGSWDMGDMYVKDIKANMVKVQQAAHSGKSTPKAENYDLVGNIMAYEDGSLSEAGTLKLFSHLIKTGQAWSLQGSYGRAARSYIEAGLIDEKGNIVGAQEKVVGGLADGKPDSAFDEQELKKGINIEMEHTDDPKVAKEIAKDHLTEDTEYYKKLAKMEADKTPVTPAPEVDDWRTRYDSDIARQRREMREASRSAREQHGQHTNTSIGRAFFSGASRGRANNMQIVDTPTETLLVGYGWAVYGARNKATGQTTYYSGWRGYSSTTSKQLSQAGLSSADRTVTERRTVR